MANKILIDPVTRIEGHLAIQIDIDSGRVTGAHSTGEMFRGFEAILKGRSPLDAQVITQRICGVCPVSHGLASIIAQDAAYGVSPPEDGRVVRNLIQAANYIQSHIVHFYQLAALDFVDIGAIKAYKGNDSTMVELKSWVESRLASSTPYPAAPFLPRYTGDYIQNTELNLQAIRHYLEALDMRALAHRMAAVFGGKLPHVATLVPGGVTEKVTAEKIAAYQAMLKKLRRFINDSYLSDVVEVAGAFPEYAKIGRGCGNFLVYGVFPEASGGGTKFFPSGTLIDGKLEVFDPGKITEEVRYSFYSSPSGLHPAKGLTDPDPRKKDAYSWIKAPRYQNTVVEVGPLARVLVSYHKAENLEVKKMVDALLQKLNAKGENLVSAMGRHAARAIECKIVADRCAEWVDQLKPGEPAFKDFQIPDSASGAGLTEAPRGALGHWLEIRGGKIEKYQCVVPTTWNCSPRDDAGRPGPVEQALVGTPIADPQNPIEAVRVVRSFDPCIACAVH